MKAWAAAAGALLMVWCATPAHAHVVEVTTTVAVADAEDQARLREAVQAAVDGVLRDAIAFTPTLIVLTRAVVIGDRVYLRLLIADRDGERIVKDLRGGDKDVDETGKSTDLEI